MKKKTIILMSKQPRYGLCKKRLSKHIKQSEILRITRNNIDNLLMVFSLYNIYDVKVAIYPQKLIYRSFKNTGFLKSIPQKNKNLGKKIWDIKNSTNNPTVIIGSDIPGIDKKKIDYAFKIIESKNIVLGPSEDGGFWLIGFSNKKSITYPFDGLLWSKKNTLVNTIKKLYYYKITYGLCDKMKDIDNINDYDAYYRAN